MINNTVDPLRSPYRDRFVYLRPPLSRPQSRPSLKKKTKEYLGGMGLDIRGGCPDLDSIVAFKRGNSFLK